MTGPALGKTCGAEPVENPQTPVENPARKILDAMSLNLKTNVKAVTRSGRSREAARVDNLTDTVAGLNQILGAVLDGQDALRAQLDSIEARLKAAEYDGDI